MWIWWVMSLIILIACAIFAYRMIVSSYQFLPADKNRLYGGKIFPGSNTNGLKTRDILCLKSKLQKIEELYYEENELKEKLENELDEISQKLEYAESKLNSAGDNNTKMKK